MSSVRFARAVLAVAAASLVLGGCAAKTNTSASSSGGPSGINLPEVSQVPVPADAALPADTGNATCNGASIAYAGALSGSNAQLGINIFNGTQLAVQQHNAANPKCQVQLKKFDTEGDPTKATGIVTQVTNEPDIAGVIGLPFSGESKAADGIFQQAGLVHITPSATNPALTQQGFTTFYRALGNDSVQGPAAAKFITTKLNANKVCVIQDDSDYGIGLANAINQALGSKSASCQDKVVTNQRDFGPTVSKVMAAKPDAVFYSGYYAEGAPLDQQLVNAGYTGPFIGPDGVKDDKFIQEAGAASSNAYFSCPCVPGELVPTFAKAYQQLTGSAPGTYSLEAYDAATVLLRGIDAGNTTRPALLNYVKSYNADGLSKHMQWNANGELATSTVYGYKVQNGKIVYVGTIS